MQGKIHHWIQWFEITLTTCLELDTSCPNSAFTVDTLHTLHEITQLLYSSRNTNFYSHIGHVAWCGTSLHHYLFSLTLPASPVQPGAVTQTCRMWPFPSQAQCLALAGVSACPCSVSCFEHRIWAGLVQIGLLLGG